MKKGILITGIVTIVAYGIAALVFLIVGLADLFAKVMVDGDSGAMDTPELTIIVIVFLSLAGYFLLGLIFSIVLIAKRRSEMGKGAGIALGIFGFLFGSFVPGILFIADSAKTRG